jgi:hypothetical protein
VKIKKVNLSETKRGIGDEWRGECDERVEDELERVIGFQSTFLLVELTTRQNPTIPTTINIS